MEQATIEKGNVRAAYEQALEMWQRKHDSRPGAVWVADGNAFLAAVPDSGLTVNVEAWCKGKIGVGNV